MIILTVTALLHGAGQYPCSNKQQTPVAKQKSDQMPLWTSRFKELARSRCEFWSSTDLQKPGDHIWLPETLNYENETIYPLGIADRKFVLNTPSSRTADTPDSRTLAYETKTASGVHFKWFVYLVNIFGSERTHLLSTYRIGSLEHYLADLGMRVTLPISKDVKNLLSKRISYAIYNVESSPMGAYMLLCIFQGRDGTTFYPSDNDLLGDHAYSRMWGDMSEFPITPPEQREIVEEARHKVKQGRRSRE